MKALITEGIVLSRTNFGEADRILTILTPNQGKLRLMAKGVRKIKSKLAGGVELFSVTELSYISGKNDIGTLVSSRLKVHYGHIIEDIDRVQLGYDLLKTVNKITEDHPEEVYFELLVHAFVGLDDASVDNKLISAWFNCQLIKANGHTPNLVTDEEGSKLDIDTKYRFDIDSMAFSKNIKGNFGASDIKVLRLLFSSNELSVINKVEGVSSLVSTITPLISSMLSAHMAY